ncbi:MAG TPA: cell division protein FtsQ/DivIB [Holophagaceae bacterium]|jgi:hypothetical protein|nr:cell division protein FtsQ/DivIB [Holophagaceae bacterium]
MALPSRTRPRRPWLPFVKAGLVLLLVLAAGYSLLTLAQRYLGLQRLVIEQVVVTGTRGERAREIQRLAEERCLHRPLFWFDAEGLRDAVEGKRWVRGLLIRKEPPDRITLVVQERRPLLWLVRPGGTYLVSEDGVVMGPVDPADPTPLPVVVDPGSERDEGFLGILNAARALRASQPDFYDRIAEFRWTDKGPTAFIEGFQAPIYLNRRDAAKNVPNFQAIFVDELLKSPDFAKIPYVDLRWGDDSEGYVAIGPTGSGPAKTIQKN